MNHLKVSNNFLHYFTWQSGQGDRPVMYLKIHVWSDRTHLLINKFGLAITRILRFQKKLKNVRTTILD